MFGQEELDSPVLDGCESRLPLGGLMNPSNTEAEALIEGKTLIEARHSQGRDNRF
jgi:hypothetical protein